MNIKILHLITLDTWHRKKGESDKTPEFFQAGSASLTTLNPLGYETSVGPLYKQESYDIPDFWKDKIEAIYYRWDSTTEESIFTCTTIVDLNLGALPSILALNPYKRSLKIDNLFQSIIPSWDEEHIDFFKSPPPKYISIFYIEPENPISFNIKDSIDGSIRMDISEIYEMLRLRFESVIMPHLLVNVILLPSSGMGGPCTEVMAVKLNPSTNDIPEDAIILPKTVLDTANYMNYIHLLGHIKEQLEKLPFNTLKLNDYVEKIKRKKDISLDYVEKFLQDREKAILCRTQNVRIANGILRAAERDSISYSEKWESSLTIETPIQEPFYLTYRYDLLDDLKSQFSNAKNDFDEVLATLLNHETILSDYFRDLAMSHASLSNIALQIRIKKLTYVTVFIGMLALVLGLVSEENRALLLEKIKFLIIQIKNLL